MTETTEQYRTRINQLNASIKSEPYIEKMRSDIAEGVSKTGNRQADIEDKFQNVIDATTGKDFTSAPEIIAARKDKPNLNARLEDFEQSTTAQFQQTAQKTALQIERERINSLSTLEEGSTTGDAELVDGRIGADGIVYDSLGNALRKQIGNISGNLADLGIYGGNLILNSDFDTTTNWDAVSASNGMITAENNELTYEVKSLIATSRIQQTATKSIIGHKYYVRGDVFPKYKATTYVQFGLSVVSLDAEAGKWNKVSGTLTAADSSLFKFYHDTRAPYVVGDKFKARKMMVLDLTVIFGAGKEPSIEVIEEMLSKFPESWFESTGFLDVSKSLKNAIIDASKISNITNYLVAKDASGTHVNPRLAVEEANSKASVNNRFRVYFKEDTYDIFSYYTKEEIEATGFVGLKVSKYVDLIGLGVRGSTHLKGEIPSSFDPAAQARVSTLATLDTGDLINLKVTAKNLRYAVHDDYHYPDYVRNVIDCDFVKYAGGGYEQAYGEGCWDGSKTVFENSNFHTETTGIPYSFHNNIGFTKPTYHKFSNCKYTNAGGAVAIRFGSMGSGQKDIIEIENCKLSGRIKVFEESVGSGAGIDFIISGYGNDVVPIEVVNTKAGQQTTYDLLGQTKEMFNGHTAPILKGDLLKLSSPANGVVPFSSGDATTRFVGIAMEDIAVGKLGFIRTGGFFPVKETSLVGLNLGEKIGIVSGELAVVNTGDIVGQYEFNGYIRLVF